MNVKLTTNCSQGSPSSSTITFNFTIKPLYRCLKNEGNLAWEYNPLRNFRKSTDSVATTSLDEILTVDGDTIYSDITNANLTSVSYNNLQKYGLMSALSNTAITAQAMELQDFTTEKLNFDLNHPVQIECQPSYDGSVNLILNDDKNPPRLINTRFTPMENNTYKIVQQFGNNDANIYDDDQFEIDTSLYKRISILPKVTFLGIDDGGACKVGNYVFYFRYEDTDGNLTDYVGETGIITCHIGGVNDIGSIKGGLRDENSNKIIKLILTDVDPGYSSVRVYYTRYTSDLDENRTHNNYLIEQKYAVQNTKCSITVSGYEAVKEISDNELNVQYNLVESSKTAAQCQNMLFMGNVNRVDIPYSDLINLSLHIFPIPVAIESVGSVLTDYSDTTNKFEYYNVKNIYNKLGYWDEEIYRLGIVYILNDFSLSPVFNIRGKNNLDVYTQSSPNPYGEYTKLAVTNGVDTKGVPIINKIGIDSGDYGIMDSSGNKTDDLENSMGVIRINSKNFAQITGSEESLNSIPIGLRIAIDSEAYTILKQKVKGFFIVRQKRIPTILAQGITIGLDKNAYTPLLKVDYGAIDSSYKCDKDGGRWIAERFLDNDKTITHDFKKRLYEYPTDTQSVVNRAMICPEAELKPAYFNQLFTGSKYTIREAKFQPKNKILDVNLTNIRHFYVSGYEKYSRDDTYAYTDCKIIQVNDDAPMLTSGSQKYVGRAGNAEEAWRLRYLLKDDVDSDATNLIRGSFGTYLGVEGFKNEFGRIVNIYIPGYDISKVDEYFKIRYEDKSSYTPITDRININSLIEDSTGVGLTAYRGDCFMCNFTHRMNRNFQDPEAPNNDVIVSESTWSDHYDVSSKEKNELINRGDVNAVKIGHWITFKLCSSINLSMRTTDDSQYEENGLMGLARGFHPLYDMSVTGESKIPESSVINDGNNALTGNKFNFLMADVPYLKDVFATRIMYSDIFINDSFRNGYRVYQLTHYRDYSTAYGGITKLISFNGVLIAVFEHAVAVIPVNERALAGQGEGGAVYINTSNVLPENPRMLTVDYGSAWIDSIIATSNYVYGVDTVAKKIWRTDGTKLETISDFRVQEFLNQNITLKEREITPVIGVRNVKTHYNAYKSDIMFTFYDDLRTLEEKTWSLCYNEFLNKWITFYSWVPSYSANIDSVFFTFDRNASKMFAKLGVSTTDNPAADGVTLYNPLAGGGTLSLSNRYLPNSDKVQSDVSFSIERDALGFYKYFRISGKNQLIYKGGLPSDTVVAYVNIKAAVSLTDTSIDHSMAQYINGWEENVKTNAGYYQNSVAVLVGEYDKNITYFWRHGQAGLIDLADKIKPCYWYGKQHPFEYEFVVADNAGLHKIFDNLQIVSNKVEPESFHYEIVGDCYDFAKDKKNMYIRQEATKELYQYNGSDILFNSDYVDLDSEHRKNYKIINGQKIQLQSFDKSTLLPLYYQRQDTINEIEDIYRGITSPNKDYSNLAGAEIVRYDNLDEYRIWNHVKAVDMTDPEKGRLRGNMQYKEDKWCIQINPLNIVQKNESEWKDLNGNTTDKIPVELKQNPLPSDVLDPTKMDVPDDFDRGYVIWNWQESQMREVKIKDKWVKIRVRYAGNKLAIITALSTLYSLSYS